MSNEQLLNDNTSLLINLCDLLVSIDDATYCKKVEDIYDSSIGSHVRHIIEHYEMYFDGVDSGIVNYDARQRNVELEVDRAYAINRLQSLVDSSKQSSVVDAPLQIITDLSGSEPSGDNRAVSAASTKARELAFLYSHTTHHHASIAMIFAAFDLVPPQREFGLAPATMRHQKTSAGPQAKFIDSELS